MIEDALILKKNRIEYYDRMSEVRNKGNYEQWVKFFLKAIYESAEDAIVTIDDLTDLHNKNVAIIEEMGRSAKNTMRVFEYTEGNLIIEIKKTADELGLSFNTVSGAVNRMIEAGILLQVNNRNRNRTFAYEPYLAIPRKGTCVVLIEHAFYLEKS